MFSVYPINSPCCALLRLKQHAQKAALQIALLSLTPVVPNQAVAQTTQTPVAAQTSEASKEAATEIISGQSRSETSPPRRSRPSTEHPRSDPAPFLTPLPPLPAGPFYGKIKKPRKHRLDQDRDGFVSKQEIELENQTRSAAFREADQNRDGKLDASELRRYQALTQPRGRGRHH